MRIGYAAHSRVQMFDYVLVVDDDPVFCEVVRTYLEDQDVKHVLVANLAGDALEILKQKSDQTGFVILDLTMPKFDGIELLKEMKDLFFSGQIAIVSSQTPTVIGMAEELGAQYGLNILGAVRKPLNKDTLDRWMGGVPA